MPKYEISQEIQRTNYMIKYPNFKGRGTFSLVKVIVGKNGQRKFESFENDRINSINQEWENSKQTVSKRDELLKMVKEIRAELHKSQQIRDGKVRLVKMVDNQKILEDFIAEKIEDRKIIDPKGQISDFTRAVLVIDRANLSLRTANRKELQKAIDKIEKNTLQRRTCTRINSLLGFIGRRERMELAEYNDTPFIFSESEFLNIIENIEAPKGYEDHLDDIKNLYYTLYYTGMRLGEAFALFSRRLNDQVTGRKMNYLFGNQIALFSQMKKYSLKITKTKNSKDRVAYVIQNKANRVQAWAGLDRDTKERLRNIEYSRLIKKAARLTYPKNSEMRRIKAHDCRHSYAVYLLNSGVSISLIAKSLGNSVLVCEKYYVGYALQEEGVQMIHRVLNQQIQI